MRWADGVKITVFRESRARSVLIRAAAHRHVNCLNQRAWIEFMKYTVSDLRLLRQMVLSANAKDWIFYSELLHKRQPHICSIIDEVGEDPRCYDAYRFCTQFCAIALERAERITPEQMPIYSKYEFQDLASLIARGQERQIGKRSASFPNRIRRYALSPSNFDEDDTQWLCTTISAVIVIIEKFVSGGYELSNIS